ncbi:MAG: hypothetical protein DRN12_00410 [Thermoplasmata archaeon]|nr:MAG: hypothetical protein DRN12_00410 [Thermoplasmata archaeon]
MNKVSIIAHRRYVDDIVYKLHEIGLMEIRIISKIEDLERSSEHPDADVCNSYEIRLTRIIDILKNLRSKPKGLKSILKTGSIENIEIAEEETPEELYSQIEGVLSSLEEDILSKDSLIQKFNEEISKLKEIRRSVKLLIGFDFLLSDQGESPFLVLKVGETENLDAIKREIEKLEYTALFSKAISKGKKRKWVVILVSHISEKEGVEKISRSFLNLFDLPSIKNTPKEVLVKTKKEIQEKIKERDDIIKQLKAISERYLQVLLALREQIQLEKQRRTIYKDFMKTDHTIIIQGWVPERDIEILKKEVDRVSDGYAAIISEKTSENPDNPPTLLETPRWAYSFKTLLQLFAIPRYREVNPTIPMGIFFIIFFGFMLGDAGYGLVIFLLSLFGYIKLRYSILIKTWSFLGIWLGISTIIVGLLTNSFFGDFIPRFIYGDPSKSIYTMNIGGVTLPLDSLKEPITILTIGLILGLIHLNLGIVLGMYQAFHRKEYKKMLTEHGCWIPLQIGGVILIGTFILDWSFNFYIFISAIILVLIGVILLFVNSGPIGFFDITGYVGDWLSYARLLALGLATAGMALAFNVVASIIPSLIPYIGIVLLPIILIVAHLANLLLQSLGAGVHSLRLQYVEFFNRFYEGGGHEFSPFKIKRRYTQIKTGGRIR